MRNTGRQKSIVTLVSFRVQAVHKGRADSVVTLQFLGGTVGDVTLDVSDMPKFKPGERVVLFVEKNGASASPLIGFYHGKFSLQKDASGRDVVLKHNGEPLADVAELGHAKRPGTRHVSRFLTKSSPAKYGRAPCEATIDMRRAICFLLLATAVLPSFGYDF